MKVHTTPLRMVINRCVPGGRSSLRPIILFSARLLLCMMLLLPGFAARAADKPAGLQDVVSALESSYTTLQDVQAAFSQKTVIAAVKKEQRGNGEVLLKRPASSTAMFRFNYTKPNQQIISNGKQVWFYLPENKQVMVSSVSSMFKGGNAIALSYLTGLGHVSRDFTVSFAREARDRDGNYQLELVPKAASPMLSKLQLTVAAEAVDIYLRKGSVKDIFPIVASVVFDAGATRPASTIAAPG